MGIIWEGFVEFFLYCVFVLFDNGFLVVSFYFGVEFEILVVFVIVENVFECVVV